MAARPCLAPFRNRSVNLALSFKALANEGQSRFQIIVNIANVLCSSSFSSFVTKGFEHYIRETSSRWFRDSLLVLNGRSTSGALSKRASGRPHAPECSTPSQERIWQCSRREELWHRSSISRRTLCCCRGEIGFSRRIVSLDRYHAQS